MHNEETPATVYRLANTFFIFKLVQNIFLKIILPKERSKNMNGNQNIFFWTKLI